MRHEVNLLEMRIKEKDQELKLADMKIRELRKQIPHLKLKPLASRSQGRASSMQATHKKRGLGYLKSRKRTQQTTATAEQTIPSGWDSN